jgi:hypothetical protein
MWGLVLSVATIASSLVTGSKGGGAGGKQGISASNSSRYQNQLFSAFGSVSLNNRQFLSGVGKLLNPVARSLYSGCRSMSLLKQESNFV